MSFNVTEIWTGNLTGKGVDFLMRQVNGYFVVRSRENGVLWHTEMSMAQDWEIHFPVI